jgi:glycerophosphoryl diester phosphodiesterase
MIRAILFLTLYCVILPDQAISQTAAAGTHAGKVAFVAHRGGIVRGYPENTIAAYRRAVSLGVHAIEIDLRGTSDGEIVIMHDETLHRTTNGKGKVSAHALAELRKLDAGGGERIPTYEEALKIVAGTGVQLLLDIKEGRTLDKDRVVRLTERYHAVLNVIVGPRSLDDLRAFQSLNPNLRTLGFVPDTASIEPFVAAGVDIIRLWPDWIKADPGIVSRVHALGMPVWVTAADAPREELEKLIALGVDGILTDFPEMMGK